jgi:hypothetical protein
MEDFVKRTLQLRGSKDNSSVYTTARRREQSLDCFALLRTFSLENMKEHLAQLGERTSGTEAGVYTWTFSGAPIRIEIGLDVIARLEAAITRSRENSAAVEIGGVLLGDFPSPGTVEVHDYIPIEAEARSKRGYLADALELERLCSRKDSSSRTGRVVGYFRTQQEHSLELRDDELEPIRQHFGDPRQVVLLIRSSAEQCTGGFLFWDGGALSPFSFLEFPFAAETLSAEAIWEPSAPLSQELQVIEEAPRGVTAFKAALTGRYLRRSLVGLSIGIVALAAVLAFRMRTRFFHAPPPAQPAATQIAVAPVTLQLEVEAQGNGLNVRWNPESKAVVAAREGRLIIVDNKTPQIISLNSQQLTRGHVYYQPSGDRVEFQLEVIDDAGRTTEESVLALSAKAAAERVQVTPVPIPAGDSGGSQRNAEPARTLRPAPRVFTIPFRPQNEEAAAPAIIRDAPAPVSIDASSASNALPASNRISFPPVAAPKPVEPPRATAPPAVQNIPPPRPPDRFEMAVPKKKVSPVLLPSTAAFIPQNGSVEVMLRVHIDDTGRVTQADPVPQGLKTVLSVQLEKVATEAALKWHFDPARLNDKPVSSEQNLSFVFQRTPSGPPR